MKKRITPMMLEMYNCGEVSAEEKQLIEEKLKTDEKLRSRLEEIKKSDREFLHCHPIESFPRLFAFRNAVAQVEILNSAGFVTIYILGLGMPICTRYMRRPQMEARGNSANSANDALNITADKFNAMVVKYKNEIKAKPNDHDLYITLGCLYINRNESGDSKRAFEYSDKALTIDKENPKALCIRGLAYYEMGEDKKALEDLRAVINKDIPNKEGVYYTIGKIYFKEGKWKEARQAFKEVMALNKEFADVNEILADIKEF
jgi:tetratricopeptide (TPR) repeat protein